MPVFHGIVPAHLISTGFGTRCFLFNCKKYPLNVAGCYSEAEGNYSGVVGNNNGGNQRDFVYDFSYVAICHSTKTTLFPEEAEGSKTRLFIFFNFSLHC